MQNSDYVRYVTSFELILNRDRNIEHNVELNKVLLLSPFIYCFVTFHTNYYEVFMF